MKWEVVVNNLMIQFHIINVLICQSWFTYKKYILVYLQMSGWLWNTFLCYKTLVFCRNILHNFVVILSLGFRSGKCLRHFSCYHGDQIKKSIPYLHNLFTDLFVFFCCKSIMVVKINWNKYMVLMILLEVLIFF